LKWADYKRIKIDVPSNITGNIEEVKNTIQA
jgi:hypothetical protein